MFEQSARKKNNIYFLHFPLTRKFKILEGCFHNFGQLEMGKTGATPIQFYTPNNYIAF